MRLLCYFRSFRYCSPLRSRCDDMPNLWQIVLSNIHLVLKSYGRGQFTMTVTAWPQPKFHPNLHQSYLPGTLSRKRPCSYKLHPFALLIRGHDPKHGLNYRSSNKQRFYSSGSYRLQKTFKCSIIHVSKQALVATLLLDPVDVDLILVIATPPTEPLEAAALKLDTPIIIEITHSEMLLLLLGLPSMFPATTTISLSQTTAITYVTLCTHLRKQCRTLTADLAACDRVTKAIGASLPVHDFPSIRVGKTISLISADFTSAN